MKLFFWRRTSSYFKFEILPTFKMSSKLCVGKALTNVFVFDQKLETNVFVRSRIYEITINVWISRFIYFCELLASWFTGTI